MARRTYETAIRILAQTKGAKTELTALTKRMGDLQKETAKLGKQKSGEVQIEQYRRLQAEIASTETAVKSLRRAEAAREALLGKRKDPAPALEQLGKRAGAVGSAVGSLARDAAVAGGALAAAAAIPLAAFSRFEKAMAEVSTLVDTNETDMAALSLQVRALAKSYGVTADEAASGIKELLSSMQVTATEATGVMEVANRLAVAGSTDVKTAVNGLTTALNSYGLKAADAGRISDVMVKTMMAAKAEIPELSDFMYEAAPTAANLGVKFEDMNAAIVALTLQGTPARVAFTRVRAALDAIVNPSKEMTAVWKNAGFATGTAAVQSLGLGGALALVSKAAKGDAGELKKLLGSVEATGAALVIAGSGSKAYTDALADLQNSAGTTDEAFGKMSATLDFQAKIVRAKANDIAISIGSKLAPIAVRALTKIAMWVDANKDKIEQWATQGAAWIEQKFIPAVQQFATQVWPVVTAVGRLVERVAEGVGGFGNLAIILGGLRLAPLALSIGRLAGGLGDATSKALELVKAMQQVSASGGGAAGVPGAGAAAGGAGRAAAVTGGVISGAAAGLVVGDDAHSKAGGATAGAIAGAAAAFIPVVGPALAPIIGSAVGAGAAWAIDKIGSKGGSSKAQEDATTRGLEEQARRMAEERRARAAATAAGQPAPAAAGPAAPAAGLGASVHNIAEARRARDAAAGKSVTQDNRTSIVVQMPPGTTASDGRKVGAEVERAQERVNARRLSYE